MSAIRLLSSAETLSSRRFVQHPVDLSEGRACSCCTCIREAAIINFIPPRFRGDGILMQILFRRRMVKAKVNPTLGLDCS